MKTKSLTLILLALFTSALFGQGSVTLNPAVPAQASVPCNGTATAGTGVAAVTCTIQGDAVPAANIIISCPLGTNGSTASLKIW